MELTQKALNEFKKIWEEENPGRMLSSEELAKMAINTLRAIAVLYRPVPRDKVPRFKNLFIQELIFENLENNRSQIKAGK